MCVHQCRAQGKVRLVQGGREDGPEALGPQLPVGDVPLSPAWPARRSRASPGFAVPVDAPLVANCFSLGKPGQSHKES